MNESESSLQLSIGSKVSEEPVVNLKDQFEEDKDSEEIEPNFGVVRLVSFYVFTVVYGVRTAS